MYFERIINIQTGEEIIREYTKEEIEEAKKAEELAKAETMAQQAREAKRESALAKLLALGLTEDEIAAL